MLSAEETHDGIRLRLIPHDKHRSMEVNALVAKAKKDGPTLLAAWHRDRGQALEGGRGLPMQKHERKAKKMIDNNPNTTEDCDGRVQSLYPIGVRLRHICINTRRSE